MTLYLGDATVVALSAGVLMLTVLLLGLPAILRAVRLRRLEHLLKKLFWLFFVASDTARKGKR